MVDALIGQKIGPYEIIARIGHGGMSEVFKARSSRDGHIVALKLLHSFHADDPSFLHRFTREARAMSQLDHPSIVRVYDFNTRIDTPFIAMEFLSGGTLKDKFGDLKRRNNRLRLGNALRIVLEIGDALAYAHMHEMVHRDIKPANIIFDADGRAVLTDFGIVKTMGATQHTTTGAMIGTPAYMSPEQGLGRAGDARSDVYALGVLFYQMVTGQLPFDADKPLAVVLKHINEPIPYPGSINHDLPEDLERIIVRALAKNPLERFQSAAEMTDAVRVAVRATDAKWRRSIPPDLLDTQPYPTPVQSNSMPTGVDLSEYAVRQEDRAVFREPDVASPPVQRRRRPRRMRAVGVLLGLVGLLMIATVLINPKSLVALPVPQQTAVATEVVVVVDSAEINPPPVEVGQQPVCNYELQLVRSYTSDESRQNAISGEAFPMNWVLRNPGSCPVPAGSRFAWESGEMFGATGGVEIETELTTGQEIQLSTTLTAPGEPGAYASVWHMFDADGNPIGPDLSFVVEVEGVGVEQAVGTGGDTSEQPEIVDDVAEPEAVVEAQELDFNIFVESCSYSDTGWVCQVFVAPFGGANELYNIVIDDDGQLAEYTNVVSQSYEIGRPACEEWVQPVTVTDIVEGTNRVKNVYFNPSFPPIADMIGGVCSGN